MPDQRGLQSTGSGESQNISTFTVQCTFSLVPCTIVLQYLFSAQVDVQYMLVPGTIVQYYNLDHSLRVIRDLILTHPILACVQNLCDAETSPKSF